MYNFDLLNIEHCNISATIAEVYKINRFNYFECEKLVKQLEKKDIHHL